MDLFCKVVTNVSVFLAKHGSNVLLYLPIYGLVPAMDVAFRSSFTIAAMLKSVRWTCPEDERDYIITLQINTKPIFNAHFQCSL